MNVSELLNEIKNKEAPNTLVLQRKNIQKIGTQKIALYFCDKIKKYFSFAYDEIPVLNENNIISILKDISEDDESVVTINFNDNTELNINKECADVILKSYNELLEEDQFIIADFIQESSDNFLKILQISNNG